MCLVEVDAHLAELAILDVIDVRVDGSLRLNPEFVEECVDALDAAPGSIATVVQDCIVARAWARGYAGCANADAMALAALELGATEETSPAAQEK